MGDAMKPIAKDSVLLTVWASHYSGPGWTNDVVSLLVIEDGNLRIVEATELPDLDIPAELCLISLAVNGALLRRVARKLECRTLE
jgi:hypothetical protein